jgi:hypothetical protein
LFTAGSSYESCPASWCASHENNIFKDTYVFINQQVTFTLVIFQINFVKVLVAFS